MSFYSLPPEICTAIVGGLVRSDLLSFCLVSRASRDLAEHELYRSLDFSFASQSFISEYSEDHRAILQEGWHEMEDSERQEEERDIEWREEEFLAERRRMRLLFRTLEGRPNLAEHVREIVVEGFGELGQVLRFRAFLRFITECPSLRGLLVGELEQEDQEALFAVVPKTITKLFLSPEVLYVSSVLPLLARLALLERLEIYDISDDTSEVTATLHLPRLRHLSMKGWPENRPGRSLVSAVTAAAPTLSFLQIPSQAIHFVDHCCFGTLTSLSLVGPLGHETSSTPFQDDRLHLVSHILSTSPQLVSFTWTMLFKSPSRDALAAFARVDILSHLSKTVCHARFGFKVSARYILRYLDRRQETSRLEVAVSSLKSEEERNRVEAAGKERNVGFEWYDHADDSDDEEE